MRKYFVLIVVLKLLVLWWGRRWLYALGMGLRPPRYRVRLTSDVRIPAPDGVLLASDLYQAVTDEACPTLLIRTPYGRNASGGLFSAATAFCARRFAERGYHVLVQDVRGRYDSQGEFMPYVHEREDGLATLAWLKAQTWYDGRVVMWGPSYLGMVQWALADADPIQALMPIVTSSQFEQVSFPDGVLDLGLALRWSTILRMQDSPRYRNAWGSIKMLIDAERKVDRAIHALPVLTADSAALGEPVPFYQTLLNEVIHDPETWRSRFTTSSPEQVQARLHLISAWHDFFLRATLSDYRALQAAGKQPYLTISAGMHFSRGMMLFGLVREGLLWFDQHLKGAPPARSAPVRLFVQGAGEWREYDSFPPVHQPTPFYLASLGKLSAVPSEEDSSVDEYRYDPQDPTPAIGGALFSLRAGRRDSRRLARRSDVLTYQSPVLEQVLTLIGYVQAELYVRTSNPHADFYVRLCDALPDGRILQVVDGLQRVDLSHAEHSSEGALKVCVDMWATAYQFQRGHRVVIMLASGAHPRWTRNTGTSDPYSGVELQASDISIYHDRQHPSRVILPLV